MKLILRILFLLTAIFTLSCDCEDEMVLAIECPCIYKDEQPPYFKSCQQMGEEEERWECMTSALLEDIYKELKYPIPARENCIEGTVVVGLLISIEGDVLKSDIKSDTILGYGLEEEALRVVKLFNNNWCSGMINCEPAEMEFVFPIRFKLTK